MQVQDIGLKERLAETKLIAFDVDGTLTDSIGQIIDCFERTFQQANLPIPSAEQIKGTIGMTLHLGIQSLLPDPKDSELGHKITELYREVFIDCEEINRTIVFDETLDLLDALKSKGFMLAIATGRSTLGINRMFNDVKGLANFFSVVVTGDVCPSKPNPTMMEIIAKRAEVPMDKILGVGDAVIDMELFKNAQCYSLGVQTGVSSWQELVDAQANFVINKAIDLRNYL